MLTYKTSLLLLFLGSLLSAAFSQNQNNQWRFGQNGAIDFNTTPPSGLTGCAIQTPEGSASVADPSTGALLFYTDGITVWNAGNQPMPNGTGLLGGTSTLQSSTSAAVIIPKPLSPGIFYLLTIDEQSSGNGLRYTVVDMSLAGGSGDIVANQKNVFLFSTTSEKLQVVPAAEGCGYWLLTHDNPGKNFAAFKITENGLQTTPVLSSVGGTQGNGAGHMKVNRQYNRLALGNLFAASIELFDFDNATGVVSNPVIWPYAFPNALIYGVEFSPNGSKLYVSNIERIVQYDLSPATPALIAATAFEVSLGVSNYQPATLQLGPDRKIYIAAGSVDAIDAPDNAGAACGFQRNAIALPSGNANYGLPQAVEVVNCSNGITGIKINGDSCTTAGIAFQVVGTSSSPYFFWNFGDPASGMQDTVTITGGSPTPFPTHTFSGPGEYTVCASFQEPGLPLAMVCRTLSIGLCCSGIISAGDSCLENTIEFSVITGSTVNNIRWNFGDPASGLNNTATILNPTHVFSGADTYSVQAIVGADCGQDTITQNVRIVYCNCNVYVPNVFTPNGDGVNDEFQPIVRCTISEYEYTVYDRWGERVFRTRNLADRWDGRAGGSNCPSDVYVYVLQYRPADGPPKTLYGDVTLLR